MSLPQTSSGLVRELGLVKVLTVRPLAAISGRVRVAGVVSRLRALVSCSITASMSWGGGCTAAVQDWVWSPLLLGVMVLMPDPHSLSRHDLIQEVLCRGSGAGPRGVRILGAKSQRTGFDESNEELSRR